MRLIRVWFSVEVILSGLQNCWRCWDNSTFHHSEVRWVSGNTGTYKLGHRRLRLLSQPTMKVWPSAKYLRLRVCRLHPCRLNQRNLTAQGAYIKLYQASCKIFRKTKISYPLIRTRTCAYQGVRNLSFSDLMQRISDLFWRSENIEVH